MPVGKEHTDLFEHIEVGFGVPEYWESPTAEIAKILRKVADDFEQNGIPELAIYSSEGHFIGEVKITNAFGDDHEKGDAFICEYPTADKDHD